MTFRYCVLFGTVAASLISESAISQVPTSVEFRVGVHTASTKRNVSVSDGVVDRTSSSLKGIEADITALGGGPGIGGRILDGTFGGAKMSLKEGRVFVGADYFRIEGAFGQRSLYGTDSLFLFTRGGARSTIRIGGSGVAVMLSGSKYFKGDFQNKKSATTTTAGSTSISTDPDGWEGETGLSYSTPKVPVFVQIGYRSEYFKLGTRAEHSSGLVLQTGLWLGGR